MFRAKRHVHRRSHQRRKECVEKVWLSSVAAFVRTRDRFGRSAFSRTRLRYRQGSIDFFNTLQAAGNVPAAIQKLITERFVAKVIKATLDRRSRQRFPSSKKSTGTSPSSQNRDWLVSRRHSSWRITTTQKDNQVTAKDYPLLSSATRRARHHSRTGFYF